MRYLFLFSFLAASTAHAILPEPSGKSGIGLISVFGTNDYRLGDEWGKQPVTAESLVNARPEFRRAALATARVGGATGFYLGKFAGQHVMATNHHVYPSSSSCQGGKARFPLLNVAASCRKFLGSWPEIDLALFTVELDNPADATKLEAVGGNFQFRTPIQAGQRLLTIGFGVAGNSNRQLMANEDSDCYVFSASGEYRLMADPDRWNPGSYRAWSFSSGCDVSHGDSGSAMVDRSSGKVVGIIWTGRIPKSAGAQSSSRLKEMYDGHLESLWEELSYAVPAEKMGEFLQRLLQAQLPPDHRQILEALLQ